MRLTAPVDFRLNSNLEEIMQFVYELRRQAFFVDRYRGMGTKRRPALYIDLDQISEIDIEGALVLAAELDRIRLVYRMRPLLDDAGWDPAVRFILHGLGLYDVVEARRFHGAEPITGFDALAEEMGVSVVPFLSCTKADPRKAHSLRTSLYERCAPPGDEGKLAVYDALVEAFNNAITHGYRDDCEGDGLPRVGRWWAGALIDHKSEQLYLVVYDQGVGIPATLPRRPWWSAIQGKLPEHSDAAIIEGALEYGRTGVATNESGGRGNGLWRMCELAETFDDADVRFTSMKGDVLYVKGGRVERSTLPSRFCGTLIRWRTSISASPEVEQ